MTGIKITLRILLMLNVIAWGFIFQRFAYTDASAAALSFLFMSISFGIVMISSSSSFFRSNADYERLSKDALYLGKFYFKLIEGIKTNKNVDTVLEEHRKIFNEG